MQKKAKKSNITKHKNQKNKAAFFKEAAFFVRLQQ